MRGGSRRPYAQYSRTVGRRGERWQLTALRSVQLSGTVMCNVGVSVLMYVSKSNEVSASSAFMIHVVAWCLVRVERLTAMEVVILGEVCAAVILRACGEVALVSCAVVVRGLRRYFRRWARASWLCECSKCVAGLITCECENIPTFRERRRVRCRCICRLWCLPTVRLLYVLYG